MAQFVTVNSSDRIHTITLNRPDVHNAFNDAMIVELTEAFRAIDDNTPARLVTLAAEGASFCAGADLNWMKRMADYTFEENVADAEKLALMLRTIRECPRPVMALVHGATFGGGLGLIAACDMAVSMASVTYCLSEVKLGLAPAVILPFLLDRVQPSFVRRYALTAERFDAGTARQAGLITEVVESVQQMTAFANQLAEALSECGPRAVARCKTLLREVQDANFNTALNTAVRCIAELRVSDEGQEGIQGFLEKRKPGWRQG